VALTQDYQASEQTQASVQLYSFVTRVRTIPHTTKHTQYPIPIYDTEYDVIRCSDSGDVNGYPGSRDPNLLPEPRRNYPLTGQNVYKPA